MASEVRRGFVRIITNYGRLLTTVVLGLFFVRIILQGFGKDAFALITLLGSTAGLAGMIKDVVRASMIRELGAAYHSGDADHFRATYNSSLALSAIVAVLALIGFAVVWLVVPLLDVGDMVSAARWFVTAKAIESAVVIALAPTFNMYLVSERMIAFNIHMVVQRAVVVIAALWVIFVMGVTDAAEGVRQFATVSAALVIATMIGSCAMLTLRDRSLMPAPGSVSRDAMKSILSMSKWNVLTVIAMNLHVRVDQVIMNLWLGLYWNYVFGLGVQLTGYTRRIAVGMTDGLDAVAARMSADGGGEKLRSLMHHSTRLHAFVTFPAAAIVIIFCEPILKVWLGDRIDDWDRTVPAAVNLINILVIGLSVRGIADGWTRILYGAGHVAKYAPIILIGGVANPIVAIALLMVLPDDVRYTAVAWSFSGCFIVFHGLVLPRIASRLLEVSMAELFRPMLRPAIITAVCSPLLVVVDAWIPLARWNLAILGLAIVAFAAAYLPLCWLFMMQPEERTRFRDAIRRRLTGGPKPQRQHYDPDADLATRESFDQKTSYPDE